jgi:hypothetical protein
MTASVPLILPMRASLISGGLEIPQGDTARYQLSVEALDPVWSQPVGPCAPEQVSPSGSFALIVVSVTKGTDIAQDILMSGSTHEQDDPYRDESFAVPLPVPSGGAWYGTLSGYGDGDYFWLSTRSNRTFSVDVLALDQRGQPTQDKARPVVGVWLIGDPLGMAPQANTPVPFNRSVVGLSQLNAQVLIPALLRLGIVDWRGDGRPDFRYRAQLLYGDGITPSRTSVRGSQPLVITGFGFKPGMTVSVGNSIASILSVSDQQMVIVVPPFGDGTQTVTIRNPATGASSELQNALRYGAASTDSITISDGNPAVPVGSQTPYPIQARVVFLDGGTVAGASVQWAVDNGASLAVDECSSTTCYAVTDEQGHAEAHVNVKAAGITTVTAQLAPSVYSGKQAQSQILSIADPKSIVLSPLKLWSVEGQRLTCR